jgi:hypothetical protein
LPGRAASLHGGNRYDWATFKYSIAADFRERHIEGGGMGTAVLQLGPNGWQIMHWHTSSARRPAAACAEKKN